MSTKTFTSYTLTELLDRLSYENDEHEWFNCNVKIVVETVNDGEYFRATVVAKSRRRETED